MGFWEVVSRTARLWQGALGLHPQPEVGGSPDSWWPYLLLAVAATVATGIGASVVLYVNRLRGMALAFALVAAVGARLVDVLATAALLWLGISAVGRLVPGSVTPSLTVLVQIVLLSLSPLVFSFLTVIPLLGPGIERLLQLWVLLVLWAGIGGVWRGDEWHPGFLATGGVLLLATLGMMGIQAATARPVGRLRDRAFHRLTGRPLHPGTQYLLDLVEPVVALPGPGATEAGGPS